MSIWGSAERRRTFYLLGLIAVVAACTMTLVLSDPSNFASGVLQVVAVVAGAGLGNALKADQSRAQVDTAAGSALRRLIEQAARLGRTVTYIEARRDDFRARGGKVEADRVADLLGEAARTLRSEIEATTSAMADWGHLSPEIQSEEVRKFEQRGLPPGSSQGAHGV